jgi:hypothetical protein
MHNIKLIHKIKEILTTDMRTSKRCSIVWLTSATLFFELIGKYCMLARFNREICFPLRVICLMGCRNAFSLLQKAFSHLLIVQFPHPSPTSEANATLNSLFGILSSSWTRFQILIQLKARHSIFLGCSHLL